MVTECSTRFMCGVPKIATPLNLQAVPFWTTSSEATILINLHSSFQLLAWQIKWDTIAIFMQTTFLSHGQKQEVNSSYDRTEVFPRFLKPIVCNSGSVCRRKKSSLPVVHRGSKTLRALSFLNLQTYFARENGLFILPLPLPPHSLLNVQTFMFLSGISLVRCQHWLARGVEKGQRQKVLPQENESCTGVSQWNLSRDCSSLWCLFVARTSIHCRVWRSQDAAFLQKQGSHKAVCSLRYERHGQIRHTSGLAPRQLKSMELFCSWHELSDAFIEGAKIRSLCNNAEENVLQGTPKPFSVSSVLIAVKNVGSQTSPLLRQANSHDWPFCPMVIFSSSIGGHMLGLQKSWCST